MNKVSKMMMLSTLRNRSSRDENNDGRRMGYRYDDRNGYPHSESDNRYPRNEYDVEDRYRDRRGREHYDNGRYAPMDAGDYEVESRRRGRFTSRYDDDMEDRYTGSNIYPMRQIGFGNHYRENDGSRPKRKIGFTIGGEMERFPDEMERSASPMRFTRQTADEWVSEMKNADGSTGPHWSYDQSKQVMEQRKINCDPAQFYAALNAVYSDFGAVAKKHGVSNIEFFADLARAWLEDKDAVPDKAAAYYAYIVEH